jgi:hypothetical protein
VSTSESQAKTGRSSLLVVVKGEHKYLVKYNVKRKLEVFDHLLEYGMDDQYNLTTLDVLGLIERLQAKKEDAPVVSVAEDQFSLENESEPRDRKPDELGPPGDPRI